MDRELTDITIDSHAFQVKTYATAREHQAIKQSLFAGTKLQVIGDQPQFNDFSPAVLHDMQQEMIRQMVVSMDGSTDRIVDRCLDLPSEEFDRLVTELDEIISKKKS